MTHFVLISFFLLDKYAIRFIPRENGVHTIDVKFNGSHIPGSPFQVRVGEPGQTGEPGLVTAYGSGLERGTTGESPVLSDQVAAQQRSSADFITERFVSAGSQSEFIINNTKASPGALAVTIEGPSKVKMDCQEIPEGYKVHYTPMAPGNYLISIKYGGPNHITGSPFKARVTGTEMSLRPENHQLERDDYCATRRYGNPWSQRSPFPSGTRLVNVTNANETSTLTLDPAVRSASGSFTHSALPRPGDSDASKVLSRGPGLSKAFVGQRSNFSLDCSRAGKRRWWSRHSHTTQSHTVHLCPYDQ